LALEAAARRKHNPATPVNLAACIRVLRAQPFSGEGLFQHFRIFALLSSRRDQGSCIAEAEMLHDLDDTAQRCAADQDPDGGVP
jgi:hypothetical protein